MEYGRHKMKKGIRLLFLSAAFLFLTACHNTDFMNLSSFIRNYNEVSPQEHVIDFGSFSVEEQGDGEILSFFPYESYHVAVRLIADLHKQIGEARIILRKSDKNGSAVSVSESDYINFKTAAKYTCYALSNGELEEIPKGIVPDSLSDINGVSEKTGESGSFYFIYRSNRLASEIVIKNKWLSPVETTKKPENKEPFAEMTETRSNTVPHK